MRSLRVKGWPQTVDRRAGPSGLGAGAAWAFDGPELVCKTQPQTLCL